MASDPRVEAVARTLWSDSYGYARVIPWERAPSDSQKTYRALATRVVQALPPSPAEEAVKRVEELAEELVREAQRAAKSADPELAHPYLNAANWLRAALASPAPAPHDESDLTPPIVDPPRPRNHKPYA